jgi:hypothetical protein
MTGREKRRDEATRVAVAEKNPNLYKLEVTKEHEASETPRYTVTQFYDIAIDGKKLMSFLEVVRDGTLFVIAYNEKLGNYRKYPIKLE